MSDIEAVFRSKQVFCTSFLRSYLPGGEISPTIGSLNMQDFGLSQLYVDKTVFGIYCVWYHKNI